MKIEEKTITPDMARDWLNMNAKNRHMRPGFVRSLTNSIRRGEWKLTHQPIAFDEKGFLLDGQHRLQAILESGVSCKALVATNADRDSFDCIDIGARRSIADIMALPKAEASVLTFIAGRIMDVTHMGAVTPQQCEPFWPYIKGPIEELLAVTSTKRRYITTAPIMSAAVLRLLGYGDRNYVFQTWRNLVLLNLQDLPAVANAFIKQAMNGTTRKKIETEQAFARGWVMFDPNMQDRERLTVQDTSDAILEGQASMLNAMNKKIKPLGNLGK